ncbi:MAG: prohibitin family protein [Chloroflexi bacterium]|nr:MAG: prohibitin family protein [Chloroflexota bacterium]
MNVGAVVSGIATIAWIVVIVVIGLSVMRATRGQSFRGAVGLIIGSIVVALIATVAGASIVFVQPTDRGVVISALDEGIRPEELQPGLNFVVPFLENVLHYPVSRQTYTMSISPQEGQIIGDDSVEARTSDGQIVRVDASVIFSLRPDTVVETHKKWQGRYVDNLIRPQVRGIIRDAVSQFGIEEVYSTQRFALSALIEGELNGTMVEGGLILHDFVLRNIAFSPEYAASVEQKQIAEQLAQQAVFVVDQRTQEAEQARATARGRADAAVINAEGLAKARVIEAQAEATALELLAAALALNPDLITFEYVQRLAPGIQVMLLPSDNPLLLPLPSLPSLEGSTTGTTPTEPAAP